MAFLRNWVQQRGRHRGALRFLAAYLFEQIQGIRSMQFAAQSSFTWYTLWARTASGVETKGALSSSRSPAPGGAFLRATVKRRVAPTKLRLGGVWPRTLRRQSHALPLHGWLRRTALEQLSCTPA